MVARRRQGLDDDQLSELRSAVGNGRRPRVSVSGSQFPDDTTGTVLRIGDEATDGAEFITVRVKAGGVTDELGFAPSELSIPRRGRPAAAARAAKQPSTTQRSSEADQPSTTTQSSAGKQPTAAKRASSAAAGSPSAPSAAGDESLAPDGRSRASAPSAPAEPPTPSASPSDAGAAAETAGAAPRGRKPGRASTPARRAASAPSVSITIASSGAAWTLTATRGARSVAKKAPLTPGVVTAVAELLQLPEIEEAVTAVNGAALDEAEARAAQLRAELAEIEAVLSSHRPPQ